MFMNKIVLTLCQMIFYTGEKHINRGKVVLAQESMEGIQGQKIVFVSFTPPDSQWLLYWYNSLALLGTYVI